MTVIGVTGTDGKTTTVNLIESILAAAGRVTGMVSTVNALIGDQYHVFLEDGSDLGDRCRRIGHLGALPDSIVRQYSETGTA